MIELLQYEFFRHALYGSVLASLLCAMIGSYIVARRQVFVSGGIAHASLGGVGVGAYCGFPPLWGAAAFALLSAFAIRWLSGKREVREDSAIAMLWTLGMSVGILCSYLSPDFMPELPSFLFGNILMISRSDLLFLLLLTLLAAALFLFFLRPLVAIAFDREFARSQHLPVALLESLMLALTALTIVGCLRMVGIVLVISMLSVPQLTANLFTQDFRRMVLLSALFGFAGCLGGLALSYYLNVPGGASIIFVSIFIYGCSKAIKQALSSL